MRHFFLTSGLVCSTLLLTGAMDRGALFSSPPNDEAFLPRSEETPAGRILDQVINSLSPDRVLWLELSVRQKMLGDDPFEAEGRYLLGPDQRLRLGLRIMRTANEGRVLAVSDGITLKRGRWLASQAEPEISEALPVRRPDHMQARQDFLEQRGLGGLLPLLRQIRQSLQAPTQQAGSWHGRPALQISGAWNAAEEVLKALPPGLRARRCTLVLDADTLWPYRIEWLGSPKPLNYPMLLLQMDFRDPVVNRPMSPLECSRAFRFSAE